MVSENLSAEGQGFFRALNTWAKGANLERRLAVSLVVLGLVAGVVTFGVMTGDLPIAADPRLVLLLLVVDLVVLLGLLALIGRRLAILWTERRRGLAGARLHGRLVALFSLVAVTPTILVAFMSVMLFDFGLKTWFSERVSTAINNSLAVAEAYTEGHLEGLTGDALAVSQVINRGGASLVYNPSLLNQVLSQQADLRGLTEAAVYDGGGHLLARGTSFLLAFNPDIPDWAVDRARRGEVAIVTGQGDDRVRAIVRLDFFNDTFLYLGRLIDPRVVGHMDRTRGAVQLYAELEGKSSGMQITFALIFAVVAMLLLLAAIWVGLLLADHLTLPIGQLIAAADQVASGDLGARVAERASDDELSILSRAFNQMTSGLETQQSELIAANRLLDYRSRFIEAVLGGVSAGVIGLDQEGRVTLPNPAACELLEIEIEQLRGRKLATFVPQVAALLASAGRQPNRHKEETLLYERRDGTLRTFLCRVVAETNDDGVFGFVATFDDITELEAAQRKAAWSDIARRIAHEIKNPLTPIQLSAERLKRKYLKTIENDSDSAAFRLCTDTIISHVGDIGRMVDEFSSFARMPTPEMEDEDLRSIVEEAVFLQQGAHGDIAYEILLPDEPVILRCDRQQIARVLTNLLLNATDAVTAPQSANGKSTDDENRSPRDAGRIAVALSRDVDGGTGISITDNGPGLPKADRYRLTEPYVTTREKGTGLGLAIVKKIIEDHRGTLSLLDNPGGGALVRLTFPPGAHHDDSDSLLKSKPQAAQ